MSLVKHIQSDNEFLEILKSTEPTKLVVVDFTASWCGPCKMISPVFEKLSMTYKEVKFVSVNADAFQKTVEERGVTAFPTFQYYKNSIKVGELQGADPAKLEELIKQHAGPKQEQEDIGVPGTLKTNNFITTGMIDLDSFIDKAQVTCLNQNHAHLVGNLFKKGPGYLESDCDEQLLITVPFNQLVKVHSLKLTAPKEFAPKSIKVFANKISLGFDEANDAEALQIIELNEKNYQDIINLKFVRFQSVSSISLLVESNLTGADVTKIQNLLLIGLPLENTNIEQLAMMKNNKQ